MLCNQAKLIQKLGKVELDDDVINCFLREMFANIICTSLKETFLLDVSASLL